jgi:hypothetical protein
MLANYLVARVKELATNLTMAVAGLAHLISLTPSEMNDVSRGVTTQPWKLNYKDANARFSNLWRAPRWAPPSSKFTNGARTSCTVHISAGTAGGSRRPIQHDCEDDKCRMRSAT